MRKYGIDASDVVSHMRAKNICKGREEAIVSQFVDGGPLAVGVAMALFDLIGQRCTQQPY